MERFPSTHRRSCALRDGVRRQWDMGRKAGGSIRMEGLSVLVWGNLPLGNTISCPTLEKVLTSDDEDVARMSASLS